jgi:hypothetical protein
MKLTLHLEGANKAELRKGLMAHLALFEDNDNNQTEEATDENEETEEKPARGKGKRAAAKKDEDEDEESFGDTEESEEAEESEEEEESDTDDDEPKATHDQVRTACGAYVKKLISRGQSAEDARSKVKSVLKKKFGVSEVDKIKKQTDLEKALKILSA